MPLAPPVTNATLRSKPYRFATRHFYTVSALADGDPWLRDADAMPPVEGRFAGERPYDGPEASTPSLLWAAEGWVAGAFTSRSTALTLTFDVRLEQRPGGFRCERRLAAEGGANAATSS
jgi:hypothetical protein